MKSIIFARVSSKDQEEGHSLDAQIQSCYEYAIKKEFQVIEQFKVVESSTASGRPEFNKMVEFVKQQRDKIIVLCYCVDRLQREFDAQYLSLQDLIKQGKLEIHYVKDSFIEHKDMDSSEKFRKNLDVLLANDYRNKISDNVKRSIKKKLIEGTILGDSPLGYLNKPRMDTKKEAVSVDIDPERGHLILQMFEDYATGMYSMEEIRSNITEQGLVSKKGKKVSKSQVEMILKNTFYYGYMSYKGMLYKHVYSALITKELYDECQAVRSGRRRQKSKRTEKQFVLKGLLKCKHCQCSYSPEIKKDKYIYMRPTKSKGKCSYCYHISEKKILSQIEEILQGMVIPEKILLAVHDELKKSSDKEHKHQISESKKLHDRLQKLQSRSKKARELYLDEEITKDEYDNMIMEISVDRHNTEAKLQRLVTADDHFSESIANIFSIASRSHEIFKSSELEEKRKIITIIFPNLQMDAGKLELSMRKPFEMFINFKERPKWLLEQGSNPRPIG